MAVTFVLKGAEAADAALAFDAERVVIGRGASSDLRLPDASVSHRHASVRREGTGYAIVDEGSTNGTFVGGVRVQAHTQRLLRTGDRVRVGLLELDVRVEQVPATRDLPSTTRDIALAVIARVMEGAGQSVLPLIRVVEGPDLGAELRLTDDGREYRIGRGDECDLPLADPEASRAHVAVRRRGHAVGVLDIGAHNQTWLGEVPLAPGVPALWRRTQALAVGRTVLALIEPLADALAEVESLPDVPIEPPPHPPLQSAYSDSEDTATAPHAAPKKVPNIDQQTHAKGRWSTAEIGIALLGFIVLGASTVGIWWLLRAV
jgi:pSer/pThr/pTyr-binding forkhead associated (FHA) protein